MFTAALMGGRDWCVWGGMVAGLLGGGFGINVRPQLVARHGAVRGPLDIDTLLCGSFAGFVEPPPNVALFHGNRLRQGSLTAG